MDPTGPGDQGQTEVDEPCDIRHKAKLGFTAHRIFRAGQNLVAFDISATCTAILDKRLNIELEGKIESAVAVVSVGGSHTQNLLVQLPRKQQIVAWVIADFVADLKPRIPDDIGMVKISAAHGAHFYYHVHRFFPVTATAPMVSPLPYRPIFQIPSGWTEPRVSRSRLIHRQARAKPTTCNSQDGGPAQIGAFPLMNFDSTETLDLRVEPQTGDSHVLTLNSTA